MKTAGLLLTAALLAGCGSPSPDAGGVSASEAQQLNDAAAMLDANSVSANAIDSDNGAATP